MGKKKQSFKFTKTSVVIFLMLSIILAVCCFMFKTQIEKFLNKSNVSNEIDNSGLVMHTIDVGQAEAIIIKLPDGKNMLIDSGNTGEEKNEKLKSYLNNYFLSLQNKVIDYFIITHSDADHCGGAPMIFENFQVNKVFRPNIFSSKVSSESLIETSYNKKFVDTNIWKNTITKMYEEPNCEVIFSKEGIEINESLYKIKFLSPTEDNYSNVNSYSPLVTIEYKNRNILFTGDATTQTEELALNNLYDCDILKVAHHGSSTSSSVEFLEKVDPEYAIISCNKNDGNNYNHPHQEVINRLCEFMNESNIYRTDINGNIILNITTNADILFFSDVQNTSIYIKSEYILIAGVSVLFIVCFSINFSKKRKSN